MAEVAIPRNLFADILRLIAELRPRRPRKTLYRELDDALGLSAMAGDALSDARTGKNGRHALVEMLRQSVFGRLAGSRRIRTFRRSESRL
jgi:hypothetical protein